MLRFIVLTTLLACAHASLNLDLGSIGWRIVGGNEAPEGAFPHQISLRKYGSHSCGGSILDKTTILTAAHCVDGTYATSLLVVTGSNRLDQGGDFYSVSKIIIHPEWNRPNIMNDIAIVKLANPIEYKDNVQPIELESEEVSGDEDCILSGWGSLSYPGYSPNKLQFIKLKTVTFEECKQKHSKLPNTPEVIESEICTFTQTGQGACHGDSGGPLIRNGKQIGVVSWAQPCAIGYPDVFTRVSSFLPWIKVRMQHS